MLAFLCLHSPSYAADIGSIAPDFSLENLLGATVDLAPPSKDALLVLLFFDPSDSSAAQALSRLNATVSKSSGALSLLGISVGNPDEVKAALGGEDGLASITLIDNKGIASYYGLRRNLPAAAIVGPDVRIVATLTPADDPGEIMMAAADAFISLLLPARAKEVYQAVLTDYPDKDVAKLGEGYATLLSGDPKKARDILDPLTTGDSSVIPEAHAAIGFLEYSQGSDSRALFACGRAPKNGFADYVMGMANARLGKCKAASSLFRKAPEGRFAFRWQRALASNIAGGTAEGQGETKAAIQAYRKAALFAPLNPTINANLLAYRWDNKNFPAATEYAQRIEAVGSGDMLVKSLVDEFEAHQEFMADAIARKNLEKKLAEKPSQRVSNSDRRAGTKRTILIPDISFNGCTSELSPLPLCAAGLLRRSLEGTGALVAIPRAEMLFAADSDHLNLKQGWFRKADQLLKVARAFSADLVTLAEVGNYKGEYLVNIRIANTITGEVIAVASERILSLEELAPAIQRSALRLKEEVTAHYAR